MNQSREFLIYYARVMLREARVRRHQHSFAVFLLNGAIRATREARAVEAQGDLFA